MPVIVWVIIAVVGIGAGTAVVVPAVIGDDKDEVKTAPADPQPTRTTPAVVTPVETIEVEPVDTTDVDETLLDEPLPEKLPYAEEPLIPLRGSTGMKDKLPF